jgi:lysophospholipase L1-like esterase
VQVVLITTPVYPTYRAQMLAQMWEPAKAAYEQVAAKYGVSYLNFLIEPRLHAVDFEDATHLNADGAAHFAHILDERVGSIGASSPGR